MTSMRLIAIKYFNRLTALHFIDVFIPLVLLIMTVCFVIVILSTVEWLYDQLLTIEELYYKGANMQTSSPAFS